MGGHGGGGGGLACSGGSQQRGRRQGVRDLEDVSWAMSRTKSFSDLLGK